MKRLEANHEFGRDAVRKTELSNCPQWLLDANTKDEDVTIQNGILIWQDGVWQGGIWQGGVWRDGDWWDGIWQGGDWRDGIWQDGIWQGGIWQGGVWQGGIWQGGVWRDGKVTGKKALPPHLAAKMEAGALFSVVEGPIERVSRGKFRRKLDIYLDSEREATVCLQWCESEPWYLFLARRIGFCDRKKQGGLSLDGYDCRKLTGGES